MTITRSIPLAALALSLLIGATVIGPTPVLAVNFSTLHQQGWSCSAFTMRCTNTDGRTADCGGGRPSTDQNQCHITTPAGSSGGATAPTTPADTGSDTTAAEGSATPDAAGPTQSAQGGTFANPLKANSLTELLTAILHGIVQLGSILLVLALVWVGFQFVAAQGAEEKIRDARNALFWTVVGGLILLGAEAISIVISSTVQAI